MESIYKYNNYGVYKFFGVGCCFTLRAAIYKGRSKLLTKHLHAGTYTSHLCINFLTSSHHIFSYNYINSYDLDPPPSSSRYKDPYSPTTTPSLPIPPHPSSSHADDAIGGSVKSVEFNARGAHYLSASAGSVSTMQELNKVWQQHDELDRLKQKGLMTSKEADLVSR